MVFAQPILLLELLQEKAVALQQRRDVNINVNDNADCSWMHAA